MARRNGAGWWTLAGLALYAFGARSGRGVTPRGALSGQPRRYAREKLPALLARWRTPGIQLALQSWGPHWFPGVPLPALLGLTASSDGPGEWAGQRGTDLSERGLWNTEDTTLARTHADATTLLEFGRAVDLGPAFARDHEGQAYLGLRRYREQLDAARAGIAVPVRPRADPYDVWGLYLAAMAFSQGASRPVALVLAYRAELSGLAPGERARALRALLVRDGARADILGGVRARGPWGAVHSAVRADQRIESGILLARAVNPAATLAWWAQSPYVSPADDAVERDAAALAYAPA
jgi:hypothetical protein